MIAVSDLTVMAGDKVLVDQFQLDITPGTLTTLLGKNGAGKSSALKAICGELQPASGSITWNQKPIAGITPQEIARKRAVISQQTTLDFSFPVWEVVALGRSPHSGLFAGESDERVVNECLDKADVLHLQDRDYTTLSGGEQQRVQFARALAQIWDAVEAGEDSYLFLDEPLASLDVAHQHQMMDILVQLTKRKVGILLVVHDLNLAAQYADQVVLMKNGSLVASGDPHSVMTEPLIMHAFDHPVNVIPHPKIKCPLIIAASVAPTS